MTDNNFAFPIPQNVLEPYIKAAVSTAIASSLGDGAKLVDLIVQQCLEQKVNHEGRVDTYSHNNKFPLVEILAKNKIRDVAKEAINEMAESMKPRIKESIEKQLKTKHNQLAQALVDGAIESLKSSWSVQVKFNSDAG